MLPSIPAKANLSHWGHIVQSVSNEKPHPCDTAAPLAPVIRPILHGSWVFPCVYYGHEAEKERELQSQINLVRSGTKSTLKIGHR